MLVLKSIINVFVAILKAHLLAILIIILSYIIENVTGLKLFIDHFKWKKSVENAKILVNRDSVLFFVLSFSVYMYNVYKGITCGNFYCVVLWLIVMTFLLKMYRRLYNKYQGIDKTKRDDDYT